MGSRDNFKRMKLFGLLNLGVSVLAQPGAKEATNASWDKLDYKMIYIEDPKQILKRNRDPNQPINVDLLERNKKWINKKDEGKEVAKKMINIPNTIPITPHGAFRFVDNSDYCWVFYPYDSDEDELSEIYPFAVDLADYLKERCAVGTIDLAYPSNTFTFGFLIDDTPMLIVKNAGITKTILNEYFERDSFSLKHWDSWGFRVTSDKLEDDLDGTLKKIIDRAWEPQNDFQKLNSIYMEWYRTTKEEFEEKKKGKQFLLDFIKEKKIKSEDGEDKEVTRSEAFEWFAQNYDSVREMMNENGMRLEPRPLPKLNDKFSKFRD